jgi:hypothetical protein
LPSYTYRELGDLIRLGTLEEDPTVIAGSTSPADSGVRKIIETAAEVLNPE